MKKSIKKLLFYSLSIGMSTLLATACTDNDQTKTSSSSNTSANTDGNTTHKDLTNKIGETQMGDDAHKDKIHEQNPMDIKISSDSDMMGQKKDQEVFSKPEAAKPNGEPDNGIKKPDKDSETKSQESDSTGMVPPTASQESTNMGSHGNNGVKNQKEEGSGDQGMNHSGNMDQVTDAPPAPAPTAPPTVSQPIPSPSMPSGEDSSESESSEAVHQ